MDENIKSEFSNSDTPKEASSSGRNSLFLSYAHKDDSIRQRIYDYLVGKNYECHYDWESAQGIDAGDNWRDRIGGMIKSAHGNVIALLSGESMKEGGVCRNELAIALNVENGRVQPILIAPESALDIPPSIVHVQWLDMSDWVERAKEPAAFDAWFEGRMKKLHEALQNSDFFSFNEEITELSRKLEVRQNLSKVYSLLAKDFYGREWLTNYVGEWAQNADSPQMLVLLGDPGFGKSAWAANWSHHTSTLAYKIAIGSFCERGSDKLTDPRVVVQTLAFSLACRDEAYRKKLLDIVRDERNLEGSAKDLFKALISEPLTTFVDGGHENVVLVIDGLDEAGEADGSANPLAKLLAEGVGELPRWLKVLVTTRDVAPVTQEFDSACHDSLCVYKRLNEDDGRWDDVEGYVRHELAAKFGEDPAFDDAVKTIKERSNGDFLYASLVVDALNSEDNDAGLESVHDITPGLSGMILKWFQWVFGDSDDDLDDYEDLYADALGFILVAPGALPVDELSVLLPDMGERKIKRFLKKIRILTKRGTDELGNETIAFNHDFVKSWLADDELSGDYYVDPGESLELMAERLFEKAQDDREDLTPYETLHTLDLLEAAGRKGRKHYDELRNDGEFVEVAVDLLNKLNTSAFRIPTVEKIEAGERFLHHIPDFETLETEESRILAGQKARLLVGMASSSNSMLQAENHARFAEGALDIYGRLVKAEPSRQSIYDFCSSIGRVAKVFDGGSDAITSDYEKAKTIYLDGIVTLKSLDVDSQEQEFVEDSLITLYKQLADLATRFKQDVEALSFDRECVALMESLIRDHIPYENDSVLHNLMFCYKPYNALATAYSKNEDSAHAIESLREGARLISESSAFECMEENATYWKLQNLRYYNLSQIYSHMARTAAATKDSQVVDSVCGEHIAFLDEYIWDLNTDPYEKAKEIGAALGRYFRFDLEGWPEKKKALVERLRPWFISLDSQIADNTLLDASDKSPLERYANTLSAVGCHEEALDEYSRMIDRLRAIETNEEIEFKRSAQIASVYLAMATVAIKNDHDAKAAEYARAALNEMNPWFSKQDKATEAVRGFRDSSQAIDNLSSKITSFSVANPDERKGEGILALLEARMSLMEGLYNISEKKTSSLKSRLSSAYGSLVRCYESRGNLDEALQVAQKEAVYSAEERRSSDYRSSLRRLERLYRKSRRWNEVKKTSLEWLELAEKSAERMLRGLRFDLIESIFALSRSMLILDGEDATRAFLNKQASDHPHVFPAVFENAEGESWIRKRLIAIQKAFDEGTAENPEIEQKLGEIISEWSGVEVPSTE